MNFNFNKFPLQPHYEYYITQYEELSWLFKGYSDERSYATNSHYIRYKFFFKRLGGCAFLTWKNLENASYCQKNNLTILIPHLPRVVVMATVDQVFAVGVTITTHCTIARLSFSTPAFTGGYYPRLFNHLQRSPQTSLVSSLLQVFHLPFEADVFSFVYEYEIFSWNRQKRKLKRNLQQKQA